MDTKKRRKKRVKRKTTDVEIINSTDSDSDSSAVVVLRRPVVKDRVELSGTVDGDMFSDISSHLYKKE